MPCGGAVCYPSYSFLHEFEFVFLLLFLKVSRYPARRGILSLPCFGRAAVTRAEGVAHAPGASGTGPISRCKRLRPRTPRLRRTMLKTLVVRGSTCSLMDRVLHPRSFCRHHRRLVCSTVASLTLHRRPISVLAITRRLHDANRLRSTNNPFCVARLDNGMTSSTRVRCRTHVVTRGFLTHRLVAFADGVRAGTFSRARSISSLVRRTRKGLFRVSRRGVGGSCARVGPIVRRTCRVLRGTTTQASKLDNLRDNFRTLSGVASN